MTMYHHAAAGVATLPSGRHSFPLDGGGGCAVGGEDEIDCRHHGGGRGEGRPGLGPHHRLDGHLDGPNGDADLYHRLVVRPRPLAQRLDVSIELAQPCRETVTENGVTKEVHVIVKQVPFSIHVRLPHSPPPLKAPKRECRLTERRCGKVRSDGDDDYHDHHHHHGHHHHHDAAAAASSPSAAMVTDLRGLEIEVRLRYDGEGGRAVPFVQRPPLDVIATRVADDGRSAVLTARVRALSSQHQNRLFVAHVRAFTPPASPEASADQSPASTTSSLPPSGAPSPATGGLEPGASAASVVLEALTEPIQVISKPRSSRKRVVRRKRTLGDMLLECTQRIERAQLAHAHAIGALSKRCRLVPRDNDATDTAAAPAAAAAAQQLLHHYEPHAPPPPQQQQPQQQAGDVNAFLMSPLEDPQLMMLMDLPAAFPHSFLPASFIPGPEQHHPQPQQPQPQHQHQFNPSYHHHYQQQQSGVKEELQTFFPAPTQQTAQPPLPAVDDPLSPPLPGSAASPCSPACASSSSSAHHHHHPHPIQQQPQQQQLQHSRDPRLRTAHAAAGPVAASASTSSAAPVPEDPMEAAAGAFLRSYAALPSFDRSMAIRRVLRKYGTDRLQALGSLLALLASRTPPPPKRAQNPNEASFQSCVCTSCSYEAELHNIDGFYKDFINLEFSFP